MRWGEEHSGWGRGEGGEGASGNEKLPKFASAGQTYVLAGVANFGNF